jgi:opacity protein-like surface antigen
MRKALIGLALTSALVASPVLARDGLWYGGIEGGVLFGDNLDVDADLDGDGEFDDTEEDIVTLDTDMGIDADIILGRDFGGFRLEAELGYKTADADNITSVPGFDLNPATAAVETNAAFDGDVNVKSAMLNGLVDLGSDDGVSFYAGGGLGYAWVGIDGGLDGVPGRLIDDSDGGFAWQGIAGLRFPLSPSAELGLKYRYFNVPNLNLVTPTNDEFETDFKSHSILASLIFNFGASAPPLPVSAPPPPPVSQPAPPPPPQMKSCPDGSRIPVAQSCPVPPPPVVAPTGERG